MSSPTDTAYLKMDDKVFLAPMVRGSELAFRQIIRRYGVKTCYSPMLRADEVVKAFQVWKAAASKDQDTIGESTASSDDKIEDPSEFGRNNVPQGIAHEDGILFVTDVLPDPAPVVVQLCGNDPARLSQATKALLDLHYSQTVPCCLEGIDLNLGCPQSCARTGHFGAFLAEQNPEKAVACIAAMRKAIHETHDAKRADSVNGRPRLSCKIRLQDTDDQTIDFAKQLVGAGCELLAIHCRRRADKSEGPPNLLSGRKLVESLPQIPIIINGAVLSMNDVHETLSQTNARGVMIATGFLANPRLLMESGVDPAVLAADYLESCEEYPPPTPLFIQKHLRWIFRPYLEPKDKSSESFKDWRPRLWTFLVRPYLQSMNQFRQVVTLYVKLNGSELPASLRDQPEPSFKSIRNHQSLSNDGNDSKKRKVQ